MDRELPALRAALDSQRAHILDVFEGLSAEQLLRPMLPSGWCCLGLVQHLAVDVEKWWFQRVVAGEPFDELEFGEGMTAAWNVAPGTDPERVFERYRQEIARANIIIEARTPDSEPEGWPIELYPTWRLVDLREVMLHVITETACHAGHLDAAVELLDGRQRSVIGN